MALRHVVLLWLVPLCFPLTQGGSPSQPACHIESNAESLPIALILDVDNTLYSEVDARSRGLGVEEQIIRQGYRFFESLGRTAEEAEEMHQRYGTSAEGLRQEMLDQKAPTDEIRAVQERFYREIYTGIDMSSLRRSSSSNGHDDTSTGYSHESATGNLRRQLQRMPYPIYLASNSPSWHIHRVLDALGLTEIPWAGILTPDTVGEDYPTKTNPRSFFDPIRSQHPRHRLVLLDDSQRNIENAVQNGIEGVRITADFRLDQALGFVLEHTDASYTFSDRVYLSAKNTVDAQAIHTPTWDKLVEHLNVDKDDGMLRVVDVGAGLLSMLEMIMLGKHDKQPLRVAGALRYHAFESNLGLFADCCETLERLGFQPDSAAALEAPENGQSYTFRHQDMDAIVRLEMQDFTKEIGKREGKPPHLIVGCCFADLMDPRKLVHSLHNFVGSFEDSGSAKAKTLLYFPITFAGTTQFVPAKPFEKASNSQRWIPSDTTAFRLYSKALESTFGHNLDPAKLVEEVTSHGGQLLGRGSSNWKIEPKSYFWETMMYFFGKVGAPQLLATGFDSTRWIKRARNLEPRIVVSNVDLLFELSSNRNDPGGHSASSDSERDFLKIEEIQFKAPQSVGTETRIVETKGDSHLGPNQVEVESVCSLISSGTELKIFKGLFDDAALDVNIDGMAEERMAYPLTYGYSLVGRVKRCGGAVPDSDELIGRYVFTFSPHCSHVIADRNSLQLVPKGIQPEDAIFLPSVETALSLVHDAHVRVGEKVAVYGQGLIGLLVTAILNMQKGSIDASCGQFGTITAFDTILDRLAAAASMGASQALHPSEVVGAGPFDVSIEVSGNGRALQSAIDHTSDGGRIVVGSWYGNADVVLKLGIDFHRSHKTLKTSQVSEIPAELRGLWTKERRFALTWELVKLLRPSRLITRRTPLSHAQEAYDALDKGEEIAIAFTYR